MSYSAEVSRSNPTCFVFLIDQSGSMSDPFPSESGNKRKAERLAEIVNKCLQNLVLRCAKDGEIRDYFHVSVVGYGSKVGPAFGGSLAGKRLVSIKDIADQPLRVDQRTKKVDDGAGGFLEQSVRFPVWFEPTANGGTPMCQALIVARDIVQEFVGSHPECFPPLVFNVTDGEATDGDPTTGMRQIAETGSTDGNTVLFNLHISSSSASSIEYPVTLENAPDHFAAMLFDASSQLPDVMRRFAKQEYDNELPEGARAFVFQGEPHMVIKALDIGTRSASLR